MPLPHYTQSKASLNKYEPIYPNLFEVTILTPTNADSGLILQHVNKIGGLDGIRPEVGPITQKYKFTDRSYAGMPGQTYADLTLEFSVNLNDANEAYIYNTMRNWYNLTYDPLTGEMGLKRDYVGSMVVVQYNRVGDIFRRITFKDVFPINQLTFIDELDYTVNDAGVVSITLRSDYWVEETTGGA